jgi:hypothetical protein
VRPRGRASGSYEDDLIRFHREYLPEEYGDLSLRSNRQCQGLSGVETRVGLRA